MFSGALSDVVFFTVISGLACSLRRALVDATGPYAAAAS